MGYNTAMMIYDCADVLNYDVKVKVKQKKCQMFDKNGRSTEQCYTPCPLYK